MRTLVILMMLCGSAQAYTCADVIWARQNLSRKTLAAIKKQMTLVQKVAAGKCLHHREIRKLPAPAL